jgi:hypothetical protein
LTNAYSPANNDSLKQLKMLGQLKYLDFGYTKIDDRGVELLAACTAIEEINLNGNRNITNQSIKTLANLKTLNELHLSKTGLTAQGIAELRQALPKCKIID